MNPGFWEPKRPPGPALMGMTSGKPSILPIPVPDWPDEWGGGQISFDDNPSAVGAHVRDLFDLKYGGMSTETGWFTGEQMGAMQFSKLNAQSLALTGKPATMWRLVPGARSDSDENGKYRREYNKETGEWVYVLVTEGSYLHEGSGAEKQVYYSHDDTHRLERVVTGRTGISTYTEGNNYIDGDVDLGEYFEQQRKDANWEATKWMATFVIGTVAALTAGALGGFTAAWDYTTFYTVNRIAGHNLTKHIVDRMIMREISPAQIGRAIRLGKKLYDVKTGATVYYSAADELAVFARYDGWTRLLSTYHSVIKTRWIHYINRFLL